MKSPAPHTLGNNSTAGVEWLNCWLCLATLMAHLHEEGVFFLVFFLNDDYYYYYYPTKKLWQSAGTLPEKKKKKERAEKSTLFSGNIQRPAVLLQQIGSKSLFGWELPTPPFFFAWCDSTEMAGCSRKKLTLGHFFSFYWQRSSETGRAVTGRSNSSAYREYLYQSRLCFLNRLVCVAPLSSSSDCNPS